MRLHFSPRSLSAYHKPSLTHLTPAIPLPTFHPSSPINLAPYSPCTLSPANLPPTLPYPQFHQTSPTPPTLPILPWWHLRPSAYPLSLPDIGHQPTGTGALSPQEIIQPSACIARLGP